MRALLDDPPSARTTSRSAAITVLSRWAITSVVRPSMRCSSASCTSPSDSASSELVASSRIRISGSASRLERSRFAAVDHPRADSSLADNRVVAVGEGLDEAVCVRSPAGRNELIVSGIRPRDPEVLRDGPRKQLNVLSNSRHSLSQRSMSLGRPHRRRAPARVDVVEARDQFDDRRFACPRRSNERHHLPGRIFQIDAGQDFDSRLS